MSCQRDNKSGELCFDCYSGLESALAYLRAFSIAFVSAGGDDTGIATGKLMQFTEFFW
jgi:hypothetical protein